MTNIIEPSEEKLLLELKKRSRQELITTQEAFEELVDEIIEEKIEWGELDAEEDNVALRENLLQRWEEVEQYLRRNETAKP